MKKNRKYDTWFRVKSKEPKCKKSQQTRTFLSSHIYLSVDNNCDEFVNKSKVRDIIIVYDMMEDIGRDLKTIKQKQNGNPRIIKDNV